MAACSATYEESSRRLMAISYRGMRPPATERIMVVRGDRIRTVRSGARVVIGDRSMREENRTRTCELPSKSDMLVLGALCPYPMVMRARASIELPSNFL